MSDLISRQAAIDAIEGESYDYVTVSHMKRIIKLLPSAQEHKTGRWIKIHWKAFKCSECHKVSEYYTVYCPNCGAEMEADHG